MKTLKQYLDSKPTIFTPPYYNNMPEYYLKQKILQTVKEWLQEHQKEHEPLRFGNQWRKAKYVLLKQLIAELEKESSQKEMKK